MTIHSVPAHAPFSAPFQTHKGASLADISAMVGPPDFSGLRPSPLCKTGQIAVYLAGSPALAGIAQRLGAYLVKVGATTQNPTHRIAALSQDRYAGFWGREGSLLPVPGADAWRQFRLTKLSKRERSFVQVMPTGDIRMCVPPTASCHSVEAAISVILAERSLGAFLSSIEGETRCAQAGIDPNCAFWTAYSGRPPAKAREVFLLDPRRDGGVLLDALEALAERLAQE